MGRVVVVLKRGTRWEPRLVSLSARGRPVRARDPLGRVGRDVFLRIALLTDLSFSSAICQQAFKENESIESIEYSFEKGKKKRAPPSLIFLQTLAHPLLPPLPPFLLPHFSPSECR